MFLAQRGPFRRPRALPLLSDSDHMQLSYQRGLRGVPICSPAAGCPKKTHISHVCGDDSMGCQWPLNGAVTYVQGTRRGQCSNKSSRRGLRELVCISEGSQAGSARQDGGSTCYLPAGSQEHVQRIRSSTEILTLATHGYQSTNLREP